MAQKALLGSIVERNPTSAPISAPKSSETTGFPVAQHRSKSAFLRGRDQLRKTAIQTRISEIPQIQPSSNATVKGGESAWREQISKSNEAVVAGMTEEEREEERIQILERFGANVGDVLRKARLARERQNKVLAEQSASEGASSFLQLYLPGSDLLIDAIPISVDEKPVERGTRQLRVLACIFTSFSRVATPFSLGFAQRKSPVKPPRPTSSFRGTGAKGRLRLRECTDFAEASRPCVAPS